MKQLTTEQKTALIERFYDNELSEKELEQFQERLTTDTDFANHIDKFGYANQVVRQLYFPAQAQDRAVLKEQLFQRNEAKTIFIKHRSWLRNAAAVLLLALVGIYWLFNVEDHPPVAYASIAYQLVKTEALTEGSTSRGQEINNLLTEIAKGYHTEKYEEVLQKSRRLDLNPSDDVYFDWQLLKGVAYYHTANFAEANDVFQQIINSKSGQQDAALWWLVTVHLDQNNRDIATARKYLQLIIDHNYATATTAQQLLEELE